MEDHYYLKAGDVRQKGDVYRRLDGPKGVWYDATPIGDIITDHETQTYLYFRPCTEWYNLHMNKDVIDIYDRMVREEHPHVPYYNGNYWAFPYLVGNEGGFGGGVGERTFTTLREAIVEALKLQPLNT
jgi:hypothetical protein